jgi:hypothetical protein
MAVLFEAIFAGLGVPLGVLPSNGDAAEGRPAGSWTVPAMCSQSSKAPSHGWGLPSALRRPSHAAQPALRILRRLHSGRVGDYVVWLLLGLAAGWALVLG